MSTKPLSTANLLEGFAIAKENLPMQVKDAYELLGITPDASKEEITKAYLDLASTYLDNDKKLDNFLNLSRALDALSKSDKSLMLYSPVQETSEPKTELKVASLTGKLWEKKLSPAFVLGLALMGGVGVFIGFSFQPKTMVIREIIREASVPTELAAPNKKTLVSDAPTNTADKLIADKAVKKEDTDAPNKPPQALQKNIGVMPPSIGPLVYVPPVGKVLPREDIQPNPPINGYIT